MNPAGSCSAPVDVVFSVYLTALKVKHAVPVLIGLSFWRPSRSHIVVGRSRHYSATVNDRGRLLTKACCVAPNPILFGRRNNSWDGSHVPAATLLRMRGSG